MSHPTPGAALGNTIVHNAQGDPPGRRRRRKPCVLGSDAPWAAAPRMPGCAGPAPAVVLRAGAPGARACPASLPQHGAAAATLRGAIIGLRAIPLSPPRIAPRDATVKPPFA